METIKNEKYVAPQEPIIEEVVVESIPK